MDKISIIAQSSRQRGNTQWILESALRNPECIIMAKNASYAKELEMRYNQMKSQMPWFRRLLRKLTKSGDPKFTSLHDNKIVADKRPIIFDNGTLM